MEPIKDTRRHLASAGAGESTVAIDPAILPPPDSVPPGGARPCGWLFTSVSLLTPAVNTLQHLIRTGGFGEVVIGTSVDGE